MSSADFEMTSAFLAKSSSCSCQQDIWFIAMIKMLSKTFKRSFEQFIFVVQSKLLWRYCMRQKEDLGLELSSIFRPNLFLIFISIQYFNCLVSTSFAIYLFLRFCLFQSYKFPEKTSLILLPLLVKQWTARYTCT